MWVFFGCFSFAKLFEYVLCEDMGLAASFLGDKAEQETKEVNSQLPVL